MEYQFVSKRKRSLPFWRRKRALALPSPHSLALSNPAGEKFLELPAEVVIRFRQLHNRLGRENGLPKKLGLTAALRGEGVTTIALGMAAVMAADLEAKICLVELNWWWPRFAGLAGAADRPGLAQVLNGEALENALLCTSLENLSLLPAGNLNGEEPTRLAHSRRLRDCLEELGQRFDWLILDIPAVLAVGESLPLSAAADQVGLVVRSGVTPTAVVQRAADDLKHLPLSYVILNGERIAMPEWLYRLIPED